MIAADKSIPVDSPTLPPPSSCDLAGDAADERARLLCELDAWCRRLPLGALRAVVAFVRGKVGEL